MNSNAQLMAMIYVDSVEQARTFYVEKLGFTHMMGMLGKDGQLDFCTVSLGGARIMLMRPAEGMTGTKATTEKRPVELYMEVADVDAYFEQLKKQKVKATTPLTEQWWGDRTFTIQDPFGYTVWFYQSVAEPKLPTGAKVV
jgi:PhnB protein